MVGTGGERERERERKRERERESGKSVLAARLGDDVVFLPNSDNFQTNVIDLWMRPKQILPPQNIYLLIITTPVQNKWYIYIYIYI